MTSKREAWLFSGAVVTAAMMAGALAAAAAEPPEWCKEIASGIYCATPEATPPDFCGTKEISVALADGFADNPWRQMTTAAAINEASRCPNVTGWTHTDGQGNTQKAISDLQGLAARASKRSSSSRMPVRRCFRPSATPSSRAAPSFPTASRSAARKARTTASSSAPTSTTTACSGRSGWPSALGGKGTVGLSRRPSRQQRERREVAGHAGGASRTIPTSSGSARIRSK